MVKEVRNESGNLVIGNNMANQTDGQVNQREKNGRQVGVGWEAFCLIVSQDQCVK